MSWQAALVLSLAVVAIAGVEVVALLNGIDGALLAGSVGAIGTVAGYAGARLKGRGEEPPGRTPLDRTE